MLRPLRIEYVGHITSRVDRKENIFTEETIG